MMHWLSIVVLSILCCVTYGVIHDQVTARICLDYFTIGHPQIVLSTDPTVLGLVWGVIATWWVGALLGIPLAFVSRIGSGPKQSVRSLFRPIVILVAVIGMFAATAGTIGYLLASAGFVRLAGNMASAVPPENHILFLTDLWIHNASYLGGVVGGIVLIGWVFWSRRHSLPSIAA